MLTLPQIPQHEGMVGDGGEGHPLPGILLQQTTDEVLGILLDAAGKAQIDARYAAVGGGMSLGLERGAANEELVQEDAEGPDVDHLVVLPALHHLRGEVVQSPAQGVAAGGRGVDGPAEVGDLDVVAGPKEEVLRLCSEERIGLDAASQQIQRNKIKAHSLMSRWMTCLEWQ